MWYPVTVLDGPDTEPVSLVQAKKQCGIASSDASYDDSLNRMISTERAFVEKYCGIKVPQQTVSMKCDDFSSFDCLPISPVGSIVSIGFVDPAGDGQLIAEDVFELRSDGAVGSIVLDYGRSWPEIRRGSRIVVTAIAGFEDAPSEIVSAILLRIGSAFALNRSDVALKKEVVEGVGSEEWDVSGAVEASVKKASEDLLENFRSWAAL